MLDHAQQVLPRPGSDVVDVLSTYGSLAYNKPTQPKSWTDLTPAEFAFFCARELRRAGWNIRVAMQGRPEEADVLAEQYGVRVAVQCTLDVCSVGYRSVAQSAVARAYEQADFGAVVSNVRFTAAAFHLASSSSILLMHYRDLSRLRDLLAGRARHVIAARG